MSNLDDHSDEWPRIPRETRVNWPALWIVTEGVGFWGATFWLVTR